MFSTTTTRFNMNEEDYKLIAVPVVATGEEKVWPKLEEGTVYINKTSDVIVELTEDEVKTIAKHCNRYYSDSDIPVTLFYKPLSKKQIKEALAHKFNVFEFMTLWLKTHNVIIYKINRRTDNGMYQLRYFDIKLNFFTYWYDRAVKFLLKTKFNWFDRKK